MRTAEQQPAAGGARSDPRYRSHAPGFAGLPGMMVLSFWLLAVLGGCASGPAANEPYRIAQEAHSGGNALAIDPESRLGASGGWSGHVRLWHLASGAPAGRWRTGHGDLSGLLFLDSGRLLTTGYDGQVRVWGLDGTLQRSFEAGAAVSSFRAAPDRSHVLLGHDDGTVSFWHVDGTRLGVWRMSDRRVTAVALATDLAWFAAADSAAKVWRWRPGGAPVELESPPTYPRALVFAPASGALLGSGWFKLFSWREGDAALKVMPTEHRGIINHLEMSSDGGYLASISRQTDSAVLLLDPHSGETLSAFRKHELCGQRVALSPDGRTMMSNSDDASVRFYTLPGDNQTP